MCVFTNFHTRKLDKIARQSLGSVLWKRYSQKVGKNHRTTHVPEPLFNKVAGLRPANFFENETLAIVFSCDLTKFLITSVFVKHLWWLLLLITLPLYILDTEMGGNFTSYLLHKAWSFPLRTLTINVNKFTAFSKKFYIFKWKLYDALENRCDRVFQRIFRSTPFNSISN